jgi:hypothetical protein
MSSIYRLPKSASGRQFPDVALAHAHRSLSLLLDVMLCRGEVNYPTEINLSEGSLLPVGPGECTGTNSSSTRLIEIHND